MPDNEKDPSKNHITINITINIGNTEIHFEQRAESGGQINKDVGTNANRGGQNAINGSTENVNSKCADESSRSGIAGDNNDEVGGQQGIKVRDSKVIDNDIHSSSNHSESSEDENESSPLLDEDINA